MISTLADAIVQIGKLTARVDELERQQEDERRAMEAALSGFEDLAAAAHLGLRKRKL